MLAVTSDSKENKRESEVALPISFAEWVGKNNYAFDDRDNTWFQIGTEEKGGIDYTTEKLFEKYDEEKEIGNDR